MNQQEYNVLAFPCVNTRRKEAVAGKQCLWSLDTWFLDTALKHAARRHSGCVGRTLCSLLTNCKAIPVETTSDGGLRLGATLPHCRTDSAIRTCLNCPPLHPGCTWSGFLIAVPPAEAAPELSRRLFCGCCCPSIDVAACAAATARSCDAVACWHMCSTLFTPSSVQPQSRLHAGTWVPSVITIWCLPSPDAGDCAIGVRGVWAARQPDQPVGASRPVAAAGAVGLPGQCPDRIPGPLIETVARPSQHTTHCTPSCLLPLRLSQACASVRIRCTHPRSGKAHGSLFDPAVIICSKRALQTCVSWIPGHVGRFRLCWLM